MSSPLNPNRRPVGKPSKVVNLSPDASDREIHRAVKDGVMHNANSTPGLMGVRINGKTITVESNDDIQSLTDKIRNARDQENS